MTIRLNPRWLLVPVILFSLQFSRAQVVVPPSLSFNLGNTNSPAESRLWDLSGAYNLSFNVTDRRGIGVPIELSFQLIQDANGKLSSPTNDNLETLIVNNDNNSLFATSVKITGKVTGSGGTAHVHFSIRIKGSGNLASQPVNSMNASMTVDADTDPSTGELVATKPSRFSADFQGQGSISGKVTDYSTPLPNGTNAAWNLTLDIVALKHIGGTALIATPNRTIGFDLSGGYKNGIFNLKAKGSTDVPNTSSGVGSSATIQLPNTFDSILLKGKLLGQSMLFSVSTTTD
jgi:hypothetical protein